MITPGSFPDECAMIYVAVGCFALQAGVENGGMAWGAALMDFDNNGFVDFISTSGKIVQL